MAYLFWTCSWTLSEDLPNTVTIQPPLGTWIKLFFLFPVSRPPSRQMSDSLSFTSFYLPRLSYFKFCLFFLICFIFEMMLTLYRALLRQNIVKLNSFLVDIKNCTFVFIVWVFRGNNAQFSGFYTAITLLKRPLGIV